MKTIVNLLLIVAAVSLVLGIISRLTVTPIPLTNRGGIEAKAFLNFTNTCLLFAITFLLLQIAKSKS